MDGLSVVAWVFGRLLNFVGWLGDRFPFAAYSVVCAGLYLLNVGIRDEDQLLFGLYGALLGALIVRVAVWFHRTEPGSE